MKKKILIFSFLIVGLISILGFQIKAEASLNGIYYRSHSKSIGWETDYVTNGATSGTVGKALPMEGFELQYQAYQAAPGDQIIMRAHVSKIGWLPFTANSFTGTTGKNLPMEAIQITLTGNFATEYKIEYRTHVSKMGWQNWVSNGETSGTTGKALAIEAIQVRLVRK